MTTIVEEIMTVLNTMTEAEQRKILAIVKQEKTPAYGIPAAEFTTLMRELNFDPVALDEMESAIDATFEQIDEDTIEPLD